MAAVEGHGTPEEHVISVHGHGRFLGELNLLTGEVSFSTAVVVGAGEVLAVPADRLKELVARDPVIGDLILRAYLLRRSILIGLGAGLRIIGSRYSPDTRRVRDFAARNRLPARWLDLETDAAAEELLAQLGVSPQDTPIVIVAGRLLRNPSNAELAAAIGLPAPSASLASCDLLVVGSGPACMSAAVYGASEGLRVIVLDGTATGGQAGTTSRIENYLGFPSGISGAELADRAMLQARKFGAQFAVPAEATSIARVHGQYTVRVGDETSVTAPMVVIATGARYRRLEAPRMEYFEKVSVYYAASQAEAQLCHGDPVVIVGGGNSAGQAAVFLARHAARVTLVVREQDLGEYMSRYLIDQVLRIPNVLSCSTPRCASCSATRRSKLSPSRTGGPANGRSWRRGPSSYSSAWHPAPAGSATWLTSTITALSGPETTRSPTLACRLGPKTAGSARCWRPASPASSPWVMSAPARRSGSPQPSARARWRSGSPSNECGRRKTALTLTRRRR